MYNTYIHGRSLIVLISRCLRAKDEDENGAPSTRGAERVRRRIYAGFRMVPFPCKAFMAPADGDSDRWPMMALAGWMDGTNSSALGILNKNLKQKGPKKRGGPRCSSNFPLFIIEWTPCLTLLSSAALDNRPLNTVI